VGGSVSFVSGLQQETINKMKNNLTDDKQACKVVSMAELFDITRRAISDSGVSRYSISKATGVDEAALCRFVHGQRGLSVESVETILDHLGYNIQVIQRESEVQ
jgi:hypothetical protein